MKRIAGIVDADASIMSKEAVRKSVTSSFLDEAVSVRQVWNLYKVIVVSYIQRIIGCQPGKTDFITRW